MPKFRVTLIREIEDNEFQDEIVIYDNAIDWQDTWEMAQRDYPNDDVVSVVGVSTTKVYRVKPAPKTVTKYANVYPDEDDWSVFPSKVSCRGGRWGGR